MAKSTLKKYTISSGKETFEVKAKSLKVVSLAKNKETATLSIDGKLREVSFPLSYEHGGEGDKDGPRSQSGTKVNTKITPSGDVSITITRDDGSKTTINHSSGTTNGSGGSTTSTEETDSNGNTTTTTTENDGEGSTSTTSETS